MTILSAKGPVARPPNIEETRKASRHRSSVLRVLHKEQRRNQQGGFALILVTVMAAVIAITLYNELPRLMFERQRVKEEILVQRANQYVRAVQLFQRKLKRAPQTIDDLENTNQLRFLRRRYVDPFTGKDDWRLIKSDELAKRKAQKQGQNGQPGDPGTTAGGTGSGLSITSAVIPTPEQLSTLTGQATTSTPGGPRRASDMPGFPRPGDPNQNPNFTDPNAPPPDPNNPPPPPQYAQPGPVVAGQPTFPGSNLPPGFLPPGVIPQQGQRPVGFPGYPTGAANSQYPNPGTYQPSPGSAPSNTPELNPALLLIKNLLTTPNPNGAQFAQAAAAGTTQMGVGIVGVASKYDAEGIKRFNDKSNIKEWEFIYDQTQDKSLQKPGGPNQIGTPIGQSGNGNNNSNTNTGLGSGNNQNNNNTGPGGFGGQPQGRTPRR